MKHARNWWDMFERRLVTFVDMLVELIKAKLPRIIIFLAIFIGFLLIFRLPYLNVFVEPYIRYFLLIVLAMLLFTIRFKELMQLTIGLFGLLSLVTLVGRSDLSEQLGNLLYLLLWLDVGMFIFTLAKSK